MWTVHHLWPSIEIIKAPSLLFHIFLYSSLLFFLFLSYFTTSFSFSLVFGHFRRILLVFVVLVRFNSFLWRLITSDLYSNDVFFNFFGNHFFHFFSFFFMGFLWGSYFLFCYGGCQLSDEALSLFIFFLCKARGIQNVFNVEVITIKCLQIVKNTRLTTTLSVLIGRRFCGWCW